jgi:hypothetical protein
LQDPKRLRTEFTAAGLDDIKVETITETMEFPTGQALWYWLVSSNPIVDTVLGSLNLTNDETGVVQHRLKNMVRERTGGSNAAKLTNQSTSASGRSDGIAFRSAVLLLDAILP